MPAWCIVLLSVSWKDVARFTSCCAASIDLIVNREEKKKKKKTHLLERLVEEFSGPLSSWIAEHGILIALPIGLAESFAF